LALPQAEIQPAAMRGAMMLHSLIRNRRRIHRYEDKPIEAEKISYNRYGNRTKSY